MFLWNLIVMFACVLMVALLTSNLCGFF
jgi:hypothetical protein